MYIERKQCRKRLRRLGWGWQDYESNVPEKLSLRTQLRQCFSPNPQPTVQVSRAPMFEGGDWGVPALGESKSAFLHVLYPDLLWMTGNASCISVLRTTENNLYSSHRSKCWPGPQAPTETGPQVFYQHSIHHLACLNKVYPICHLVFCVYNLQTKLRDAHSRFLIPFQLIFFLAIHEKTLES